eukprot:9032228-Alexandrium_andersonii.AAC.1
MAFYERQEWEGRAQEAYDTLLGYMDAQINRTRLASNQDAVLHGARKQPAAPAAERGRGRGRKGKGRGDNPDGSK